MKLKKQEHDSKRSFTVIDILICAVFLAAVVYIGIRVLQNDSEGEKFNTSYSVTMILSEERKDAFKVGDVVLSSDGRITVGKITNVSLSPAYHTGVNIDVSHENEEFSQEISDEISEDASLSVPFSLQTNGFVKTEIEGYISVTVTVSADLERKDGKYLLNNSVIKIGDKVEITTREYSAVGICNSISELKNKAQETTESAE